MAQILFMQNLVEDYSELGGAVPDLQLYFGTQDLVTKVGRLPICGYPCIDSMGNLDPICSLPHWMSEKHQSGKPGKTDKNMQVHLSPVSWTSGLPYFPLHLFSIFSTSITRDRFASCWGLGIAIRSSLNTLGFCFKRYVCDNPQTTTKLQKRIANTRLLDVKDYFKMKCW